MKNILTYVVILSVMLAACKKDGLEAKKEELAKYKKEAQDLKLKIKTLQKEIATLDTTAVKGTKKGLLVNTASIQPVDFKHKIEIRGAVESRRNVMLTSETAGIINDVRVSEGQKVSKGQVLVVLDGDILRNSIAEIKTNLELATAVYERQSNLWEKKIGTEMQYLEAKANKEGLERKLATTNSQLAQTIVKAPFSGMIDQVPARVGEMSQPGRELVRIVSPEMMYIDADVSERYIDDFKVGDEVELHFPIKDKTVKSVISSVSSVLKTDNRTFSIEVKIPKLDFQVNPNQVVMLKLIDYEDKGALVVPTQTILSDSEGQFLYKAVKTNKGSIAKKQKVKVGQSYDGVTQVLEGVKQGDLIVVEGHRSLTDEVAIQPVERSTNNTNI